MNRLGKGLASFPILILGKKLTDNFIKMIYSGKSCNALFNADLQSVVFTFKEYLVIDEHKEMYKTVRESFSQYPIKGFIFDFRKMKGTFTSITQWAIEELRPVVNMGLKYEAMILNDDIFTSFAVQDFLKRVKTLEIQVFTEKSDAEKWMMERIKR